MKKVALVAVMIAALVLGIAGAAIAADEDVVVSAKINPAFSMTINQNAVSFDGVDVGSSYSDDSTVITVKSNKLWDFTKGASVDALLDPVLTESTDVAAGTGLGRGVVDITATYDLDLTGDAAYDLEADTAYTATYSYTAVQQ